MIFVFPILASLLAGTFGSLMTLYPDELCINDCRASMVGKAFIRQVEGYSPVVYADSGGLGTICHGHLIKKGEKFSEPMTPWDCEKVLENDLRPTEGYVNKGVVRPIKDSQFDALTSFSFNVGGGAFLKSTLLKVVNQDKDPSGEFMRWTKVKGKEIKGLINRRRAESSLYNL